MSNKIDRRSFLKVLGIAGAACAMTALTGCDEEGTPSFPAGDGSVSLSSLKPFNGSVPWNGRWLPEDPFGNVYKLCNIHIRKWLGEYAGKLAGSEYGGRVLC